ADRYVNSELNSAGALYRSALLAAVGGYFVLRAQPAFREKFPADYPTALVGSLIMIATLAVGPFSSVIADRFGYYVTPIQIMIMARLPYVVSATPTGRLIAAAPYAGLAAVLVYWAGNSRHFQLCYLPYQSWLSWP
ncbi:MAG: EpsG family protein, partial [Pseudomonadota bacterium]